MQLKLFQVFRSGTFKAMHGQQLSFSDGDLQSMAAAFNPQTRPAPLVPGHPRDDQPAMGQVTKLVFYESKLYALAMVGEALVGMVRAKSFKGVSASFFPPFSDENPTPGAYYLKHVGFLSDMQPAVKGMESPAFAEHSDGLCFAEAYAVPSTQLQRMGLSDRAVLDQLAVQFCEACPEMSYVKAVQLAMAV